MAIRLVNTSRSLLPFPLTYLFEKQFENEQLFHFYFKNHLMYHGYKIGMYMNVPPFSFSSLYSQFLLKVSLFSANKKQHDLHVAFGYFLSLIIVTTSATL